MKGTKLNYLIGGLVFGYLIANMMAPRQVEPDYPLADYQMHREFEFKQETCNMRYNFHDVRYVFEAHRVEWNIMGKERAWWSVLTGPDWPQTNNLEMKDKLRFYGLGKTDTENVPFPEPCASRKDCTILDFGCGLARLSYGFALRKEAGHVICVDQSVHHLILASKEVAAMDPAAHEKIEFLLSDPNMLVNVGDWYQNVDFVYTQIALQHMVQPLQIMYIEQLCDVLRIGGTGQLQVNTGHSTGIPVCNLQESIDTGGMQMHKLPAATVRSHLERRGCEVDVGGEWFLIRKVRSVIG